MIGRLLLRREQRWNWLIFLIAGAFFWQFAFAPDGFVYRPNSRYSDLTITHWPNALFIRESLARWGQVPLWRPLILGGEPFAANPLSGLWYPPNLLLLLLPLTPAFNLLFILHTAWAGWGGYRLARETGASPRGAALTALSLMFAPKAIAHLASGHIGLYAAWAWLPWAFWAIRRLAERGQACDVATAAATIAMMILADVRLGFYGGIAAAGYWAARIAARNFQFAGELRGGASRLAHHASRVAAGIGAAALAGMLVAVQALPLAMVAGRLNRGGLSLAESGIASLPPRYLAGLLVADHGGFQEWMTYVGVVGLALAIVALRLWRSRERWWWGGLALAAMVYSLGTYIPLYGVLYRLLPPLGWLRGPARAWFLAVLGVSVLASRGLTALEAAVAGRAAVRRAAALAAVGLAGAALAGVGGALALRLPANVSVAAGLWPLVGMLVALRSSGRLRAALFARLALALALADLWIVGFTLYRVRPAEDVLAEGREAAEWLAAQEERPFRVYSPSYSIPHHTGAVYGVESADGVDPFQLADYAAFMRVATGVDVPGYSVTIPSFPQDQPADEMLLSLRDARPNLDMLGLLNVRYLAAAYPLDMEGLTPMGEWGGVYVYRNDRALPRAFVQPEDGEMRPARLVEWTPNRIQVEAEGPGLLVLSEVYDPDWRAEVDGRAAEIVRVDGILRGVSLGAGLHRVVFSYWPAGLSLGIGLSAAGVACLTALWRRRVTFLHRRCGRERGAGEHE